MRAIGVSTYCMMHRPLGDALETLSQETGLIEILSDSLHSLFLYAEVCASFDLRYTVHAPTTDLNIALEHERMRRASIQVVEDLVGVCDRIGASVLVVHPGVCMDPHLMTASERALRRSLDDLSRLQEACAVTIAIENMGSWPCCHFRDTSLLPVLDDLGLGFVLDIGHAHLNGNLEAFLRAGSPVHLHLHDNGGALDEHAACGTGTIDFSAVLDSVSPRTTAVIEVQDLGAVRPSLAYMNGV
ncbi:Xylose isomerase domain-containing protein TIM barrel [Methanofollis liminatans DSM 4140]|uniref:Xylose isomerase domain-containing protein TIM barrel n=1 Tax=Methanofollis liminatans DSM 4140 TaxID=28892 RepID=J0RY51_9EURY|nr:sugar phosphate isomerase/epimerase family protein [Methanofollis liminatans]EJG06456.1 Xylose isomerase domain-containing protein TIM barrel [Methanofollis liminatans DSM 4140]